MKKALIVTNLGGFSGFLFSDMKILRNMGYDITFAANCNVLPWEENRKILNENNVKIINIDFNSKKPLDKNNYLAYKQMRKLLKNENYDLIHCHTPIAGFITRFAARNQRKKGTVVIYTTHGFSFTKYSSFSKKIFYYNLEKFFSRYSDAIITINKEDFESAKKMHSPKVFYINGVGVDIQKYRRKDINICEYRKSLGIDYNKKMILSIGELSTRKNHKIIIEALSRLENKEDFVYVICGNGIDGGTATLLENIAKEKKVNLKLLGFRHDIPEIITCSDFGAIPSIREGLGLAGIQSLAAGIPLIASDVQGIKDYVIEGETGYLCNPFCVDDFERAIKEICSIKSDSKIQERCVQISEMFDISISKQQREKIYNELLKK